MQQDQTLIIPDDVWHFNVFPFLQAHELIRASRVNRSFYSASHNNFLWSHLLKLDWTTTESIEEEWQLTKVSAEDDESQQTDEENLLLESPSVASVAHTDNAFLEYKSRMTRYQSWKNSLYPSKVHPGNIAISNLRLLYYLFVNPRIEPGYILKNLEEYNVFRAKVVDAVGYLIVTQVFLPVILSAAVLFHDRRPFPFVAIPLELFLVVLTVFMYWRGFWNQIEFRELVLKVVNAFMMFWAMYLSNDIYLTVLNVAVLSISFGIADSVQPVLTVREQLPTLHQEAATRVRTLVKTGIISMLIALGGVGFTLFLVLLIAAVFASGHFVVNLGDFLAYSWRRGLLFALAGLISTVLYLLTFHSLTKNFPVRSRVQRVIAVLSLLVLFASQGAIIARVIMLYSGMPRVSADDYFISLRIPILP